MAMTIREFLDTKQGRVTSIAFAAAVICVCGWMIWSNLTPSVAMQMSNTRHFICSETGKEFTASIDDGESYPRTSPYTGKKTGYPAEACYWTRDGKIKSTPTYVLVNSYLDKPGPTFCPDCGRLVVARNPRPQADRVPPTEAEYKNRKPTEE